MRRSQNLSDADAIIEENNNKPTSLRVRERHERRKKEKKKIDHDLRRVFPYFLFDWICGNCLFILFSSISDIYIYIYKRCVVLVAFFSYYFLLSVIWVLLANFPIFSTQEKLICFLISSNKERETERENKVTELQINTRSFSLSLIFFLFSVLYIFGELYLIDYIEKKT